MTRLEGILLGALVAITPDVPPAEAPCHAGICEQRECSRCRKILDAHAVIEKALKAQRQRKGPTPRRGRRVH